MPFFSTSRMHENGFISLPWILYPEEGPGQYLATSVEMPFRSFLVSGAQHEWSEGELVGGRDRDRTGAPLLAKNPSPVDHLMSDSFLFLLPLPSIFLPSFPIPLALPLPILAAPFPVPTPTSLPVPAAPLPRSLAAEPGCRVARLPAAPPAPLPRLSAPLPAPLPTSSPPLPISLPGPRPAFCFASFFADCVSAVPGSWRRLAGRANAGKLKQTEIPTAKNIDGNLAPIS